MRAHGTHLTLMHGTRKNKANLNNFVTIIMSQKLFHGTRENKTILHIFFYNYHITKIVSFSFVTCYL